RPAQPREGPALPAGARPGAVATGVGEQLVARAADRRGDALEELAAERRELRDEDPDDVRPVAAQAAGDQARLVAELLDDGPDALGGRRGDAVAAVDHLRHRGGGDACRPRHVVDGHALGDGHGGHHTGTKPLSIPIDMAPVTRACWRRSVRSTTTKDASYGKQQ